MGPSDRASFRPSHGHRAGLRSREATRDAAAKWGLPDFIFRPARSNKGAGRREIGDALLVAGDLAACIQVKTRGVARGSDDKERLWLDKKLAAAKRQAAGSIRTMRELGPIPLMNERGREIVIDAHNSTWVNVIIIDHPGIDRYEVPGSDTVVLLRRDWEFLCTQLRSTYVVLQYLHHVSTKAQDTLALAVVTTEV